MDVDIVCVGFGPGMGGFLTTLSRKLLKEDGTPASIQPGCGTVLLVDDEELIRVTATHLLKKLGYEVLLAENGKEGVEIFAQERERIDLVISDMIMPIMDGMEMFRALQEIDPAVKVVVSSGFTRDDSLEEMRARGLAGVISKPYRLAALSQALRQALHS